MKRKKIKQECSQDVTIRLHLQFNWRSQLVGLFLLLNVFFLLLQIPEGFAASAGYSLYYIPADETNMRAVFEEGATNRTMGDIGGITDPLYSIIGITVWNNNTHIYIDHWEDGYEIDLNNPDATADEVLPIYNTGATVNLISQDVPSLLSQRSDPSDPSPIDCDCATCTPGVTPQSGCYYDGKDKIYVIGGNVTVSRAVMPEQVCNDACTNNIQPNPASLGDNAAATVQAVDSEVYPVRPQLTTYIMPFGEDMVSSGLTDFTRTFALIQATSDNTAIQVDFNADGVYDPIDGDRDGDCNGANEGASVILNEGETLLLTRDSDGNAGTGCGAATALNSKTVIHGSATLQVTYMTADPSHIYDLNSYSAFPTGYWDDEYYAPVDGNAGSNYTDIYLHNPHGVAINVNYELTGMSGTISIPANSTVSYRTVTGSNLPNGTSAYFRSQNGEPFWAVSMVDTESASGSYDWGYSLIPGYLASNEYFMGWAPAGIGTILLANYDDSGLYIASVQDNNIVFVDFDANGPRIPVKYSLNRLQTQYVYDSVDGDISGAHIYSTAPFVAAFGENPDLAPTGSPGTDMGYTTLPGSVDWIDLVLGVEKSVSPVLVGTGLNQVAKYTVQVRTNNFSVDDIRVADGLATGWGYCTGTNTPVAGCLPPTLTFPDGSLSSNAPSQNSYNVYDGSLDIDGNGSVNGSDDGWFDSFAVIDGRIDINGDGSITTNDDGRAGSTGVNVIDGMLDITGNGSVDGSDDQTGFSENLNWNKTNFTGGQLNMGAHQTLIIEYYAYTTAAHAADSVTIAPVTAAGDRFVGSPSVKQTFEATDSVFNYYATNRMDITKTSNLSAAAYPGDTINYTVTVSNPSGLPTLTNIAVFDALPEGVSYVAASGKATGAFNVADNFSTQDYNRNDGSVYWAGVWVESDGTQSPTADNVQITGSRLLLGSTANIYRQVNLAGATSATLTLDYQVVNADNGEYAYIEAASSSAGPWTTVASINGNGGTQSGTVNYSIPSGLFSATTTIRCRVAGYDSGEYLYIDNVNISFPDRGLADPPNFINSSDGYALAAGQNIVLTFSALVDNPLDTGISELINSASATSQQIPLPIEASVNDPVVHLSQSVAAVGDRVWLDTDGDGIQDVGESGVANVEVTLKDYLGTPLQTTITDSQGRYQFAIVAPKNAPPGFSGYYYVEVTGGLPAGLTQTGPSGHSDNRTNAFDLVTAIGANRDNFETRAYTNTDGSISWSSYSWTETDATAGGATGGEIQITNNGGANDELRINGDTGGVNNAIERRLNIPDGAFEAILSFNFRTTGVESGDSLVLQVSKNGGAWTTLNTYAGYVGSVSGSANADISAYLGADTRIRFKVNAGYGEADDYFFVDNVDIAYSGYILEYKDADLGYKPASNTAIVGDLVWIDANGDGLRNSGEPGLGGVVVRLYTDSNGNGEIDTGEPYVEATTDSDGSYFFAGVSATGSEDYIAYIEPTQSALSAYDITTNANLKVTNAISGGAYFNADFGFKPKASNTHFSVKDRLWVDTNSDGDQDVGETGVSGVTVALMDNSGTIIATTTSGSNGDFEFVGVPANARYSWKITDQSGVLGGYFGTTPSALTGEYQMPGTLTGNLDYSGSPHFGYNQNRSIGDTVFNDSGVGGGTVGNGIQDGTEPGISGVTVLLYQDRDGDGIFEPGGDDGSYAASMATDSNGKYLFTGLANARYWVAIDNSQASLAGYDLLTTADDETNPGHQREYNMIGGVSELGLDYGYRASANYSLSGVIWNDSDNNGANNGESGIGNVTVELLLNSVVIRTATTAADGSYSFAGLPSGTYTVRVTDSNGILSGYETTYEKTEGPLAGSYNYQEIIASLGANVADLHFGYNKPTPTLVVISSFNAYAYKKYVLVSWATSSEVGSVGFNLYRSAPLDVKAKTDENAPLYKINDKLLPGVLNGSQGGVYAFIDTTAAPGLTYKYQLEEVELDGGTRVYGPFTVASQLLNAQALASLSAMSNSESGAPFFSKMQRQASAQKIRRIEARKAYLKSFALKHKGADSRLLSLFAGKTHSAVVRYDYLKMVVDKDDAYFVSAQTIATELNRPVDFIKRAIKTGSVQMTSGNLPILYASASDYSGLYFYGEAMEGNYTDDNVYWLSIGRVPHANLKDKKAQSASSLANLTESNVLADLEAEIPAFLDTVHVEQDKWLATAIFNNPEDDFMLWDYVFAGYKGMELKSFSVPAVGAIKTGTATLTVHLKGGTNIDVYPDHHVVVLLNGTQIGETMFEGTEAEPFAMSFDQSLLLDGGNTVEVKGVLDNGVPYSLVYIDSIDLSYWRQYMAVDNILTFKGLDAGMVVVEGFTKSNILVFDITEPKAIKPVAGVHIDQLANNSYEISFGPSSSFSRYIALTSDMAKAPAFMAGYASTGLKKFNSGAQYVIIAPAEFRDEARTLGLYRRDQGLQAMFVSLEEVIDEFNAGIYSPYAIKNFLTFAYNNWRIKPQYVLLLGEGTVDYQNKLGNDDNLLPPILVSVQHGLFASDNRFADVSGNDGIPEFSIGRIPVATKEELAAVVAKIMNYEKTVGAWRNKVMMAADNADKGGRFGTDSDKIGSLIPLKYTVERIYLDERPVAEAHQTLLTGLNQGALFLNYIGHSGLDSFAEEGLLTLDDLPSLNNQSRLPVVTAMTCVIGRYELPGYDSLGEALLLRANGGAVAVWAPTGLSYNNEAVALDEGFYKRIFLSAKKPRLGDAVLTSLREYGKNQREREMIDIYNLLGDPGLVLK